MDEPDQPYQPYQPDEPPIERGSVEEQGPDTPRRAPSPAAERRRQIAAAMQAQQAAEQAARAKKRKRVMIGSAVGIGVVGLLAVNYASASSVRAHCVDDLNNPVSASYCDRGVHTGSFFYFGGRQYHYYYGGRIASGGAYTGGSVSKPSHTTIKTDSGHTIQRGGFGAKSSSGRS